MYGKEKRKRKEWVEGKKVNEEGGNGWDKLIYKSRKGI
jgi:hypothetical protein